METSSPSQPWLQSTVNELVTELFNLLSTGNVTGPQLDSVKITGKEGEQLK